MIFHRLSSGVVRYILRSEAEVCTICEYDGISDNLCTVEGLLIFGEVR